jgi:hypothetical protein
MSDGSCTMCMRWAPLEGTATARSHFVTVALLSCRARPAQTELEDTTGVELLQVRHGAGLYCDVPPAWRGPFRLAPCPPPHRQPTKLASGALVTPGRTPTLSPFP